MLQNLYIGTGNINTGPGMNVALKQNNLAGQINTGSINGLGTTVSMQTPVEKLHVARLQNLGNGNINVSGSGSNVNVSGGMGGGSMGGGMIGGGMIGGGMIGGGMVAEESVSMGGGFFQNLANTISTGAVTNTGVGSSISIGGQTVAPATEVVMVEEPVAVMEPVVVMVDDDVSTSTSTGNVSVSGNGSNAKIGLQNLGNGNINVSGSGSNVNVSGGPGGIDLTGAGGATGGAMGGGMIGGGMIGGGMIAEESVSVGGGLLGGLFQLQNLGNGNINVSGSGSNVNVSGGMGGGSMGGGMIGGGMIGGGMVAEESISMGGGFFQNLANSISTGAVTNTGVGSSISIGGQTATPVVQPVYQEVVMVDPIPVMVVEDLDNDVVSAGNINVSGNGSSAKVGLQNLGNGNINVSGSGSNVNVSGGMGGSSMGGGLIGEVGFGIEGGFFQNLGTHISTGKVTNSGVGSSISIGGQTPTPVVQPVYQEVVMVDPIPVMVVEDLDDDVVSAGNISVSGNGSSAKVGLQNLGNGNINVSGSGSNVNVSGGMGGSSMGGGLIGEVGFGIEGGFFQNLGKYDQTVALGGQLPHQTDLKVPKGNNIDIFLI